MYKMLGKQILTVDSVEHSSEIKKKGVCVVTPCKNGENTIPNGKSEAQERALREESENADFRGVVYIMLFHKGGDYHTRENLRHEETLIKGLKVRFYKRKMFRRSIHA